jgi:hypothetical protein
MRVMQAATVGSTDGDMRGTRRNRPLAATLAALALLFTVGCSSASAALFHPFVSSFGATETPGMGPGGVAIDNSLTASAGDVYVSDALHSVVNKFSATGSYLTQITGTSSGPFGTSQAQNAVNASGDVYVADTMGHVVDEFDPTGAYLSQIQIPEEGTPYAVSVDGSGEVLIAVSNAVYKYDPASASLTTFATGTSGGAFGFLGGVAVDGDPSSPAYGDVYVVDFATEVVDVFDSSGTYLSHLTGTPSGPFPFIYRDVVDPASGDLYVTAENAIDEFGPTGAFLDKISDPHIGFVTSVAVNAASGDIYAADFPNEAIDMFGPSVVVPEVTMIPPTNLRPKGVTLHGKVGPAGAGAVTSCQFEYGTTASYGEVIPCTQATPYSKQTDVSAGIKGLTPDTVYHYRLSTSNANGPSYTDDSTFETTGPPTIEEESTVTVLQRRATLQGEINPHGFYTVYRLEYGGTESYGHTRPRGPGGIGSGVNIQIVNREISGLKPNTTYHYRFVVKSSQGTVFGPDRTFTTPAGTCGRACKRKALR